MDSKARELYPLTKTLGRLQSENEELKRQMQEQSQKQLSHIESLNTKYEETKNQLEKQNSELECKLGDAFNSIETDKLAVELLKS